MANARNGSRPFSSGYRSRRAKTAISSYGSPRNVRGSRPVTMSTIATYLPKLAKIRHAGVTPDIAFDGKGDLTHGLMTISQVRNDKWVVISN